MTNVGIIGLGDMGLGMAGCLVKAGFDVVAFDRNSPKRDALEQLGGRSVVSPAAVGEGADIVFVMVTNGPQAIKVTLGEGLIETMKPGSIVVMTATIKPAEAQAIERALKEKGIGMVDCPVSGGRPGAENGTLTLMVGGEDEVVSRCRAVFDAIAGNIYRVGGHVGTGQTVKACLTVISSAVCVATAEAAALAGKAGVDGEAFEKVLSTSVAGSFLANTTLGNILDNRFYDSGSRIRTLHKDLSVSLDFADGIGVPMTVAKAAHGLLQSGIDAYPDADNWVIVKVLEAQTGAELRREKLKSCHIPAASASSGEKST